MGRVGIINRSSQAKKNKNLAANYNWEDVQLLMGYLFSALYDYICQNSS